MEIKKFEWWTYSMLIVLSTLTTILGYNHAIFILNENQVLYLFSTSAQVMAGIYGLTITGFIFFINELNREQIEDETLDEVANNLKKRFFRLLKNITFLSIATLFFSNLSISMESQQGAVFIFLINTGQSLFIVTIILIAYFIFDIIDPNKIKNQSKTIYENADPNNNGPKGSLEEFLTNYNKIEEIIQKYGMVYKNDLEFGTNSRNNYVKRLPNSKLAEFILRAEKIDGELYRKLTNLISLRNSIVHGAEPNVSQKIVNDSKVVLKGLQEALDVQ